MLTERLPMLTENVHLVPLQGHVTGTWLLMIIVRFIPQSVSKRRFAPSLSGQGLPSTKLTSTTTLQSQFVPLKSGCQRFLEKLCPFRKPGSKHKPQAPKPQTLTRDAWTGDGVGDADGQARHRQGPPPTLSSSVLLSSLELSDTQVEVVPPPTQTAMAPSACSVLPAHSLILKPEWGLVSHTLLGLRHCTGSCIHW